MKTPTESGGQSTPTESARPPLARRTPESGSTPAEKAPRLFNDDGTFNYLNDEQIFDLSPEQQTRYFDNQEAALDDFWRTKQKRLIDSLGEESYRIARPADAARYYDER